MRGAKPCDLFDSQKSERQAIELFHGFWRQPKSTITGIIIKYSKEMCVTMQFSKDMVDDELMDGILKEAADGYGDLIAEALVHNVTLKSLEMRVKELRLIGVAWIS